MADPAATLEAHEKYALPLGFADDGAKLYTGGFGGRVAAWDTADWTERQSVQAHEQSVNCGTTTAADRLVTGSTDASLRVWSAALDDPLQTLDGHDGTVAGVASHPSEPLVASASYDETVRVWTLDADDSPVVLSGHSGNVTTVAFVAESTVVSGGLGDEMVVWGLDSAQEQARVGGHGQAVVGVAAPDRDHVWSVGYDGTLRHWAPDDWTATTAVSLERDARPTGIAVN